MESRETRQSTVAEWCRNAFGASSLRQRGIRLLEEAAEAAQTCDVDVDMAHRLLDYVWSRPKGALAQELGGVGLTTLALAEAAGLSADGCERAEVQRVLSKPLEHFRKRNQEKNQAGFAIVDLAE